MPPLRDLAPGLWFRVPALEIEGLIVRQLPHQTVVRLVRRRDGELDRRSTFAPDLEVEHLSDPPASYTPREAEATPETGRRTSRPGARLRADPTSLQRPEPAYVWSPDPPDVRIERAATSPLVRRYCGHCRAERLAYHHRTADRCVECGRPTMPLHRPDSARGPREHIVHEVNEALAELSQVRGRSAALARAKARLRAVRQDIVPHLPAARGAPEAVSWWRRRHWWRLPQALSYRLFRESQRSAKRPGGES